MPAPAASDTLSAHAVAQRVNSAARTDSLGQTHGALAQSIRQLSEHVRGQPLTRTRNGRVAGARIAAVTDHILTALFNGVSQGPVSGTSKKNASLCLLATGGYGRAFLSPYSDIDLLILHGGASEGALNALSAQVFYPLWDAGLKLSQGVHTISSAIRLAKNDLNACTAFLDARIIAGNEALGAAFFQQIDRHIHKQARSLIAAKRDEQIARHESFEQSRYLTEPDIKQGKGGLRDIDQIGWLTQLTFGRAHLAAGLDAMLTPDDQKALTSARDFLLSARYYLHHTRQCDDNRLSFDVQQDLAEKMGYGERAHMRAAERLMRHYFITATDVGRLAHVMEPKLEVHRKGTANKTLKPLPASMVRALRKTVDKPNGKSKAKPAADPAAGLAMKNGYLTFSRAHHARKKPVIWFRLLYVLATNPGLDIHPDALCLMAEHVTALGRDTRDKLDLVGLFRRCLVEADQPGNVLRLMVETGIIHRFLPAFAPIVGRIRFGLYRRYTLDEQSFRALDYLTRLRHGDHRKLHPLATRILAEADDPYPYYLSVLLQEVRQGEKISIEKVERKVERLGKRLGLSTATARDVAFAAAHHDLMVNTVDRRTVSDPDAVRQFCQAVGSLARLNLLLVGTVCLEQVIGTPGVNERFTRKLRTLFEAARVYLTKGEPGLQKHLRTRLNQSHKKVTGLLTDWDTADVDWLFDHLRDTAIHAVDPSLLARFAPLLRAGKTAGLNAGVSASLRDDGSIEAIVYARDRTGLLSDLAGAVASLSLSVRSVQAVTAGDNHVIDVFVVQSVDGSPLTQTDRVMAVHRSLLETAQVRPRTAPRLPRKLGDRRSIFDVTPQVIIDSDASQTCIVVEALGLDRPGLLYKLTRALSEIGVIIRTAHVATYGERAVDSFYLQDAPGYKITNPRRIQSIERRLLNVLTVAQN
ncbi:MAG: [protein-PII] uridylyltransferase [Pseudomonadota bacterium]